MSEYEVDVQIEIPLGSNIKYEFDHEKNMLRVDRILHTPMYYFFNYGYIPNTIGGDGDPLDAVVLCKERLYPTAYIKCKIIGVIHTEDEAGIDDKIILVPIDKIDKESEKYNNIDDISEFTIKRLKCFFQDYKKLESNKWVKIQDKLGDREVALEIYNKGIKDYNQ